MGIDFAGNVSLATFDFNLHQEKYVKLTHLQFYVSNRDDDIETKVTDRRFNVPS